MPAATLRTSASASRAVVVQIDGLTPDLLDVYLRSPASRQPGRALARWLLPSMADGSALSFGTAQLHRAVLPLPALSDATSAVLLTGRTAQDLDVRDPGDGLPDGVASLVGAVPHSVGVGFRGMPALEANDEGRVEAALQAEAQLGQDGATLLAVRLSSLGDALGSRGLGQGPDALAKVDALLDRLLVPPFTPDDTLLVVTSGSGAAPGPTQAASTPSELSNALGVEIAQLQPTGGVLRVSGLKPEKVETLYNLAATEAVVHRVADGLRIYDPDLRHDRVLMDGELATADTASRLAVWLKPEEWAALARREAGFEFRRVGEDAMKIALGGVSVAESTVPVVFGGAVPPGASHAVALEAVAPTVLELLGRDPLSTGATEATLGLSHGLAAELHRARHENVVDLDRIVLEHDVPTAVETALKTAIDTEADLGTLRRRSLSEGEPYAGPVLATALSQARAVVQVAPARVAIDTPLLAAWGGLARVELSLEGLDAEAAAARVRMAVRLSQGLRILRAGVHPAAAAALRDVHELAAVSPEVAPWHTLFLYWAERAAALETGAKIWPTAPSPESLAGPDAAWLAGLVPVVEALTPQTTDGVPESDARRARIAPLASLTDTHAAFGKALVALFSVPEAGDCTVADPLAERARLTAAAEIFTTAGESGLAARAWQRVETEPQADAATRADTITHVVARLGEVGAGWARLDVSRQVLSAAVFAPLFQAGTTPSPVVEEGLRTVTRLHLLKLQQNIVLDRAPGFEQRNIDRVTGLVDGSAAREPDLTASTLALAIGGRADLQGRIVGALLTSGFNLFDLITGRGTQSVLLHQRLIDLAAAPLPGADLNAPEARLVSAVADGLAFISAYLTGTQPVPPYSADDALGQLDLVALRNEALAKEAAAPPAPNGGEAAASLVTWGPFIQLAIKAEMLVHTVTSDGPQAALPVAEQLVDLLARLCKGEAARTGNADHVGKRVDTLAAALKAALGLVAGQGTPESLQAALAATDASPPEANEGVPGRVAALMAVVARDAGYVLAVRAKGKGADASLLAPCLVTTRALMAQADTADSSVTWRYGSMLLHGSQAALQDAPAWISDASPGTILRRSAGARSAIQEIARRLRADRPEAALVTALQKDDLGALLGDQLALVLENIDDAIALGESNDQARRAALRDRWIGVLRKRLDQATAGPTGGGVQIRALLHYALAGISANAGKTADVEALADSAAKLLPGTSLADKAWIFPLQVFAARLNAGQVATALEPIERAAKACPGQAWHLDLARAWLAPDAATALAAADRYVARSRQLGQGGLNIRTRIAGAHGHDVYQAEVGTSLQAILLGRSTGTFQVGAGADSNTADRVTLDWDTPADTSPRAAAQRAWLVLGLSAALRGDDPALDSALGRLLGVVHGEDPSIFLGLDAAAVARLPLIGSPEPITDPVALAWLLTLAEARGHLALAEALWSQFKAQVATTGWEKALTGTDFSLDDLCPTAAGSVTQDASNLACLAPRNVALRLDKTAVSALASLVSATVARVVADSASPDPLVARKALVVASVAVPVALPRWTRGLYDARFPTAAKPDPKASVLPPRVEAVLAADQTKLAPREAVARIHQEGGVCEAALRAANLGVGAADVTVLPRVCGAGGLYAALLLSQRSGTPAGIVTEAGLALTTVHGTGPAGLSPWDRRVVAQVAGTLLVGDDDIRAATFSQSAALTAAAQAAGAPELAYTLRAFVLAWAGLKGLPAPEAVTTLVKDAEAENLHGSAAVRFVKRLRFETGVDGRAAATAFLVDPLGAAFPQAAPAAPAGNPAEAPSGP